MEHHHPNEIKVNQTKLESPDVEEQRRSQRSGDEGSDSMKESYATNS